MGNTEKENKKFYIVARTCDVTGIGAILVGYISHAVYAIDNGFIPIIDLKHYKNQYFKDGRAFKDNSWEYFFEQPCGYSLNDIDSDSEVIISNNTRFSPNKNYNIVNEMIPISDVINNDSHLMELKSRYQSLLKLNSTAKQFVEDVYERVMDQDLNVLGVLCRGTDYTIRRPFSEPIQPTPNQVIKKIYEFLKKHPEINKIYLATEDNFVYETFKKEFGDKLLDNNQYRFSYSDKEKPFLCDAKTERPNHNYQLGLEYLSSLYILSKCKYFIGGLCAGSIVAWIMQDCWQDLYIYKLGYYGKSLKERLFSKITERSNGKDYTVYNFCGIKIKIKIKQK